MYYRRYYSYYKKESQYENLCHRLSPIIHEIEDIFLNLDDNVLENLLFRYKKLHGDSAYNYAKKTYPKWKNRKVKFSVQTAERLVDLVPRYLKLNKRFEFVEKLVIHYSNKNSQYHAISIDLDNIDIGINNLRKIIENYLSNQFSAMQNLPTKLIDTISWINDNDMIVSRKILDEVNNKINNNTAILAKQELLHLIEISKNNDKIKSSQSIELIGCRINVEFKKLTGFKKLIKSIFK
jgi:hypothetical protein